MRALRQGAGAGEPRRADSGPRDGPTLALISHTDTVLADPEEWTVDPWSGELRDGEIWGRGALDMKSHVAAAAVAVATLAREGFVPAGDLIFVASADEEVGEDFGLSWLCARPSGRGARRLLRQRGRWRPARDQRAPGLPVRDRREDELAIRPPRARTERARVDAGNRGQRTRAGGAAHPAAGGVQAEDPERCRRPRPSSGSSGTSDPDELEQPLRAVVEPMLSHAISPTIIEASKQTNVIPALCTVVCDCRLLPGETQAEAEAEIRGGARRGQLRLRLGRGRRRHALRPSTLRSGARSRASSRRRSRAPRSLPSCNAGFTDSHFMRAAFGTVCYGFFPMRAMDVRGRGGADPLRRRAHPGGRPRAWNPLPHARGTYTRRVSRDKVRLGGMALANGVLVHGPRYWACAVRLEDGGVEVASGLKPLRASEIENRLIRGPARMAEIFALLPEIRRRLPAAQLPFQRPAVVAAMVGSAAAVRLVRGSRLSMAAQEILAAALAVGPAAVAMRGSNLASYHGAEHISIGTYEHGEKRAKEHERCGSHLLGPLLLTSAVGNALDRAGAVVSASRCSRGGGRRRARGLGGALLLDGAEREEPARPRARDAGPRAPAPLRHGRAHARAARGREPRSRRMRPPRICCKWR